MVAPVVDESPFPVRTGALDEYLFETEVLAVDVQKRAAADGGSAISRAKRPAITGTYAAGRVIAVAFGPSGTEKLVGLIARRIVCDVKPGDSVTRGGRYGMIKFGSRTELYIPKRLEPQIRVQLGQKVRGALDVLAVVKTQA